MCVCVVQRRNNAKNVNLIACNVGGGGGWVVACCPPQNLCAFQFMYTKRVEWNIFYEMMRWCCAVWCLLTRFRRCALTFTKISSFNVMLLYIVYMYIFILWMGELTMGSLTHGHSLLSIIRVCEHTHSRIYLVSVRFIFIIST